MPGQLQYELLGDASDLAASAQAAAESADAMEESLQDLEGNIESLTAGQISYNEAAEQYVDEAGDFISVTEAQSAALEGLQDQLSAAESEAEETGDAITQVITPGDIAAVEAYETAVADAANETDNLGTSARTSRADVRALFDEAAALQGIVTSLSTTQILAGGTATLGLGAVGAAGGLAAGATALAAQLGPKGLQQDLTQLAARAKATGRTFSSEFAGVIRTDVIPTVRNLLRLVRQADESLADFTAGTFEAARALRSAAQGEQGTFNQFGAQFIQGGLPRLIQKNLTGDIPLVPNRGLVGLLSGAVPSEGATSGERGREALLAQRLREIIGKRQTQLQVLGRLRRQGIVGQQGALQQRVSTLRELVRGLVRLDEKTPNLVRQSRIDRYIQKLKEAKGQLAALQSQQAPPPAPSFPAVQRPRNRRRQAAQAALQALPNMRAPAMRVQESDDVAFDQLAAQLGQMVRAQNLGFNKVGKQIGTTMFQSAKMAFVRGQISPSEFQQFKQAAKEAGIEVGESINQNINRSLAQSIRLASQLGATMVRAAQRGSVEWNQLLGSILQTVGSIVSIGNAAIGAGIAGAGTVISSFHEGGFVGGPRGEEVQANLLGGEFVVNPESAQAAQTALQMMNERPKVAGAVEQMVGTSGQTPNMAVRTQQQTVRHVHEFETEMTRVKGDELAVILRKVNSRRKQRGHTAGSTVKRNG